MAVDNVSTFTITRSRDGAAEQFSAEWWQRRTAEELRDIINRGFAGGQTFRAAVDEVERRSREETRRLRDVAARQAEAQRKRNRFILAVGGALAALAIMAMWILA